MCAHKYLFVSVCYQKVCAAWWNMTQNCGRTFEALQMWTAHTAAAPPCYHTAFLRNRGVTNGMKPNGSDHLRVAVCVYMLTKSLQRWTELEGAHGSRRVLVKLYKDGLGEQTALDSDDAALFLSYTHTHTNAQALSCTCRLRRRDSRVSVCLRVRQDRPLVCKQN